MTEGHCSTCVASSFYSWEAQETRRFTVFVTALTFLIANNKMLIKTFAANFISNSPSVLLLPANQSLDDF